MKKGIDEDKLFEALRNCITEQKCMDCPWEECERFDCKKTEIPVLLGLDILELLKETCGFEGGCNQHEQV